MSDSWDEPVDDTEDDDPGFLGGGGPGATMGDGDEELDEHGDRLAGDEDEIAEP